MEKIERPLNARDVIADLRERIAELEAEKEELSNEAWQLRRQCRVEWNDGYSTAFDTVLAKQREMIEIGGIRKNVVLVSDIESLRRGEDNGTGND